MGAKRRSTLRLQGAFGRPPVGAGYEKSPRIREGFAYEIMFAAQVRLLVGDQVGQAGGDGEQHHELAQERCHGATEPRKADSRGLSCHQGETRQRATAEDAMAHTAIAIASRATNPTSMVIGVWFPWICFTFVAAFILTRHPFSLA